MSALSPHLPLHDLLRGVISRATEKLAADEQGKAEEGKKVEKLLKFEKKEHGHIPSVKEEEAEYEKTASPQLTSPEYITKLASAVEHIASNVHLITPANEGALSTAIKKLAGVEVPPAVGESGLRTETPITGKQVYVKDKAKTHRPETEAGKPLSAAGMPGGATQLHNTMHEPSGAGPNYPAKGPLVNQTKTAARDRYFSKVALNEMDRQVYGGGGLGAGLGKLVRRGIQTAPDAPNTIKTASIARQLILQKLAGEDVLKASISASASASPLSGGGVLQNFDASQKSPHQPGDPNGGFGNQARTHISSNMAAINAKKGQLKGPVKTQLKELLDEPALSPATDTILQKNLRSTGEAGVKIAANRALLQKIASEGTPAQRMKLRQMVKQAMDGTLAQGMAPQAAAAPAGNAPPMASGDEAPDGCTCNQTGECRVCKLKAAMAAARGEGQVTPQNPNPQY